MRRCGDMLQAQANRTFRPQDMDETTKDIYETKDMKCGGFGKIHVPLAPIPVGPGASTAAKHDA